MPDCKFTLDGMAVSSRPSAAPRHVYSEQLTFHSKQLAESSPACQVMAIALTPFVRLGYSPHGRDALVVHVLRDVERTLIIRRAVRISFPYARKRVLPTIWNRTYK